MADKPGQNRHASIICNITQTCYNPAMSQKLTLQKVSILSFSRKSTGGTVKVMCPINRTIAKAMGWDDGFPLWQKSATCDKTLAASLCEFTPTHEGLVKHAIDLATSKVRYFELIRTQIKNGKSANKAPAFKTEVHCSIDFTDEAGAQKLEQYMHSVAESTMQVTYEPEPVQQELEGVAGGEVENDREEAD